MNNKRLKSSQILRAHMTYFHKPSHKLFALLVHKCTDNCCNRFLLTTFWGTPLLGMVRSTIAHKIFRAKGVHTPNVSTAKRKSLTQLSPQLLKECNTCRNFSFQRYLHHMLSMSTFYQLVG